LDARLARLLSISNGTRQTIIHAIWQYIKTHKLQDFEEREFINCDAHLQSVRIIAILYIASKNAIRINVVV
jgi:SWI/SNF-related matrix-associated actin-dependent regulator of chromatin subfamily D